jgi:hypothetical protein
MIVEIRLLSVLVRSNSSINYIAFRHNACDLIVGGCPVKPGQHRAIVKTQLPRYKNFLY